MTSCNDPTGLSDSPIRRSEFSATTKVTRPPLNCPPTSIELTSAARRPLRQKPSDGPTGFAFHPTSRCSTWSRAEKVRQTSICSTSSTMENASRTSDFLQVQRRVSRTESDVTLREISGAAGKVGRVKMGRRVCARRHPHRPHPSA